MVYLTGGVAFADVEELVFVPVFLETSTSNTRVGWTVGARAVYLFTPNWIGGSNFFMLIWKHGESYPARFSVATSSLSHQLMIVTSASPTSGDSTQRTHCSDLKTAGSLESAIFLSNSGPGRSGKR